MYVSNSFYLRRETLCCSLLAADCGLAAGNGFGSFFRCLCSSRCRIVLSKWLLLITFVTSGKSC